MSPLHVPKLFPPERGGAMTLVTFRLRVVEKPKQICQRRDSNSTFILPSINIQVCLTFLGHIRLLRIKYMAPSVGWMAQTSVSESVW